MPALPPSPQFVARPTDEELEKLHILRRVALESVRGLIDQCLVLELPAGATLLEAGQSNQTMYMLLSGRLRVHLDSLESEPIAFLDPGQTVGEMSVIDDSPVSAFVAVAEPARLLAVEEDTFWRLVAASHELAVNLLFLLAQRMRANNTTIREASRLRRLAERDATFDALTGLHNRRWLDATLPRLVSRHQHAHQPLSLMLIDVDHFKSFNDTYGHLAGDRALSTVSGRIAGSLRPTDLSARYGGEEMVVILPETPLDGAIVAAERLRASVASTPIAIEDARVLAPVTVSIGTAELCDGETALTLVERADRALYRAKELGRNRVVVAD